MSVMEISRQLRLGNFAAFHAVEHNPDSQIRAAGFELVLRSCGDKQQVACLE